jgi:hypothetical protein
MENMEKLLRRKVLCILHRRLASLAPHTNGFIALMSSSLIC